MMYDLDLRWPDGHVEAMEVTIAIDTDLLRLDLRLIRHGSVIPAKESTRDWTLLLASGITEVRALKDRADHLLSLLERRGVTSFSAPDEQAVELLGSHEQMGISSLSAQDESAAQLLRQLEVGYEKLRAERTLGQLGVAHGLSFGGPSVGEQATIKLLGPAPAIYFVQPESNNKVIEDHARRNAKKLALSGCDERHLFALFDFSSPEGANAFAEQRQPPELPPRLPDAVTTVWAASVDRIDIGPVVWRVRRGGPWEVLL